MKGLCSYVAHLMAVVILIASDYSIYLLTIKDKSPSLVPQPEVVWLNRLLFLVYQLLVGMAIVTLLVA
jgi:hypothetical protein